MTSIETVGTIVIKILKVVLNLIILILYRTGFGGYFLGVGGTWNLNEEKNPDVEIIASGVFVGYMIYTIVSLISLCFSSGDHKTTFTDILMNIIGVFMWIAVGATALHYWYGYLAEHKYSHVDSERQFLCAVCLGFIYDPASIAGLGKSHMFHVGVMYTAYTGYMVVNSVLIVSRILKEKIPYRTVSLFSLVGSSLFLITCILLSVDRMYLMKHYFYHPNMYLLTMMTTSIIFAFINAVVMAADAAFTFVMKADF